MDAANTASLTVGDIMGLMEAWYPASTAEPWDKVGLICGDPGHRASSVLLALDPVDAVAQQAREGGFDMVITHHPLLLRGASFLPVTDPKGSVISHLIRSDIALFNAHTNADVAHLGVAEALAALVGVSHWEPLEPTGTDSQGRPIGLGRVGDVEPQSLGEFADRVAAALPASPAGLLVGGDEARPVRRAAVLGGSGDSLLQRAREAGADVYLTADLRHHPAQEHLEGGAPALLCGSHWATESPWLPVLAGRLAAAAAAKDVELRVEVSTIVTEPWSRHRATLGGTA